MRDTITAAVADAGWRSVLLLAAVAYLSYLLQSLVTALFFHPLSAFPGPKLAAVTCYRKAFIECVLRRSWHVELEHLHARYGSVVRVGPNELHFSNPQAYHDIYNNKNRWDKEEHLYHSFGEDRSSFGFLTYNESRERKDVLNKSMSAQAIGNASGLVLDKVNALCDVFSSLAESKTPADLSWAFRCMTLDIITYLCFGKSVDAINSPAFASPLLIAMDASLPVFIAFKHSTLYKNMIVQCPPNLSKVLSPPTAGLVDLQTLLKQQIAELTSDPDKINYLPHNMTIYHSLMDKDQYKNGKVPVPGSLYEEAQALLFAGADTVGNTLLVAMFNLLRRPKAMAALKSELLSAWPSLSATIPSLRELERLPYLNACLKESLRLASGVISGLPRVVPATGAQIDGVDVPGNCVVSCGSTFVHYNQELFPNPTNFQPERWIDNPKLDNWMVAFSRGPRSCLGINLAWMELRYTLASVIRRFDFQMESSSPQELVFRECFLPEFQGPHVKAQVSPATP